MSEREKFLYELDGRGFEFQDKSHTEYGFNDEVLNMVYEMWNAGFELGMEESQDIALAESRKDQKRISVNLEDL